MAATVVSDVDGSESEVGFGLAELVFAFGLVIVGAWVVGCLPVLMPEPMAEALALATFNAREGWTGVATVRGVFPDWPADRIDWLLGVFPEGKGIPDPPCWLAGFADC